MDGYFWNDVNYQFTNLKISAVQMWQFLCKRGEWRKDHTRYNQIIYCLLEKYVPFSVEHQTRLFTSWNVVSFVSAFSFSADFRGSEFSWKCFREKKIEVFKITEWLKNRIENSEMNSLLRNIWETLKSRQNGSDLFQWIPNWIAPVQCKFRK
jgi:hypothetical protein